ncbi:MAG TPA: L-fucose/L-arabinose isomerase family protein [Anaerolineae bacterium]|jgi:L-arabinose isomerase
MERTQRPKPRIGYFGSGLAAYWPQFPKLKPGVLETMERHAVRLEALGCEVIRGGLVDCAERSNEVGDQFARAGVDLIIGEIMTYTASHVLVPIAQRNIAPYLTLALQMVRTVPYEQIGTEEMTLIGASMTAPEVSCAFQRCGLPFNCIVGGDFQDEVWKQVQEWIEASATKRALRNSRLGYLGHFYPGMLDMYTDFTMHQGDFGAHIEILEMCDLAHRVHQVSEAQVDAKVDETRQTFLMPPPGYDAITEQVTPDELRWAARVACAEDKLVQDFALDGLAYYYRGWADNEYERIGAAMILGNSLLTARGIPCAGEADLKTCVAMFIQEHFNAGGSFCEMYLLDFEGGFVVAGHDGPGHIAIGDKKPILRGMKLFHGKAGSGVSVEFNVKNGPVTMLGVTQTRDGRFKFIAAEGESIPGPILQTGNTNTRVRFGNMKPEEFGQAWTETGSTHHFALGVGHQLGKVEKLAKLLNIELAVVCR